MTDTDAEKLELTNLETRVDELIKTVKNLADENKLLRSQQTALASERAALVEKTEEARRRVEGMIERLKAMENRS